MDITSFIPSQRQAILERFQQVECKVEGGEQLGCRQWFCRLLHHTKAL